MNDQPYLSDEELMELIGSVENAPLHTAPPYLKRRIQKQAAQAHTANTVMAAIPKKHELFYFGAKVVAAAAAAIALLIVMPSVQEMEQIQAQTISMDSTYEEKESVFRRINDKTNYLFRLVTKKADEIFFKEEE